MSAGKWNGMKWIRPEKRLALYIRDGFQCTCCGRSLKNAGPGEVALDHLLPRSAGGGNEATNLVTICRACNSSRQDKPWVDFYPAGSHERVQTLRSQPLNLELAKAILNDEAGDPESEAQR
jgi:5-methylcytosine-specific restriction endonuclease McrA